LIEHDLVIPAASASGPNSLEHTSFLDQKKAKLEVIA
jgi:hypothetical protein